MLDDSEGAITGVRGYELQLIAALLLFSACWPEGRPGDLKLVFGSNQTSRDHSQIRGKEIGIYT